MESLSHETLNGRKVTELYITMLTDKEFLEGIQYLSENNAEHLLHR